MLMYLLRRSRPPIREYDSRGQLVAAGFQWDERPEFWLILSVLLAPVVLSGATLKFALDGDFVIAMRFLMAALASGWLCVWLWSWRRSIVFYRDGRVMAPGGIPERFGIRKLRLNNDRVTSIEVMNHHDDIYIAIFTSEGETFIVSHCMRSGDARLVAVQLTKALRELRQSMSSVKNFAAPQVRILEAAWID